MRKSGKAHFLSPLLLFFSSCAVLSLPMFQVWWLFVYLIQFANIATNTIFLIFFPGQFSCHLVVERSLPSDRWNQESTQKKRWKTQREAKGRTLPFNGSKLLYQLSPAVLAWCQWWWSGILRLCSQLEDVTMGQYQDKVPEPCLAMQMEICYWLFLAQHLSPAARSHEHRPALWRSSPFETKYSTPLQVPIWL